MITSEFNQIIHQFLEAKITVQQLEEWLVPRLPSLVRIPTSSDANTAAAIELDLAELNAGIRTIIEFRKYLEEILQENHFIQFVYPENSSQVTTSGSNYSSLQLEFVDNELEGAVITY